MCRDNVQGPVDSASCSLQHELGRIVFKTLRSWGLLPEAGEAQGPKLSPQKLHVKKQGMVAPSATPGWGSRDMWLWGRLASHSSLIGRLQANGLSQRKVSST